ncbi:MAG: tRNA pseudouridine(55) synthase TruB [Planctomycetota bacterium]
MSRRRNRGLTGPNGILLVDKPRGPTTRDVLRTLSYRLGMRSTGHCGTLDPLATGLVVVVSGAATRIQDLLTGSDKTYRAGLTFGATSATEDAEGPITPTAPEGELRAPPRAELEAVLAGFVGEYDQRPPVFSAVRIEGRRLHKMAREGELPEEIPLRRVRIDRIELIDYDWPRAEIEVACGAGTYVRSLGRDIGEALGVGAYLHGLRRTRSGDFDVAEAHDPETVELDAVLPLERAFRHEPGLEVSEDEFVRLLQGKRLPAPEGRLVIHDEIVRLGGRVAGRLRALDGGRVFRMRRLIVDPRRPEDAGPAD